LEGVPLPETDTKKQRVELALKVCHLYYEDELSQGEIAQRLQISRPTISRLLQFARDQGLVQIKIADPLKDLNFISTQLEAKFGLKKALVVYDASGDENHINDKLGAATADYLDAIVRNGDRIGISWGHTIEAVANHLHETNRTGVQVVQLKGSVSESNINNFGSDILSKFGAAFHTSALNLPLPVIFDNAVTKDIVLKDRFINAIIEAGEQTNIALFTCGTVRNDSLLFNLGYLKDDEIKRLQTTAVGDIVSRFIATDGSIADKDINDRTVGIQLDQLRNKEYAVLVAGSAKKLDSVQGALRGGYANVLITDERTATDLLKM
jgi:deoxyribonucleoside regulator